MTLAFKVMKESSGGVTLESILDMTFPDLVELWGEAIQVK